MSISQARRNLRDKQLGGLRTLKLPVQVRDFIDQYINDILEREGQYGDMKSMLRNAYMLGVLHGNQVGAKADE